MPFDRATNRYYPDIQPPQQALPDWVQMDDGQNQQAAPNVGAIGSAFKQRLMGRPGSMPQGDAGGGAPTTWPGGDVAPKSGGIPGSKGGFKSL
jgi:hypothetical protein